MKTWADTLIRVQKYQEQALQMQMAETAGAMRQLRQQIDQLCQDLVQADQACCQIQPAQPPHLMAQQAMFCHSLRNSIAWHETRLCQLREQESRLRGQLRAIAEKRIVLTNLRQKHCQQAEAEITRKEEELASEVSLQEFAQRESHHER